MVDVAQLARDLINAETKLALLEDKVRKKEAEIQNAEIDLRRVNREYRDLQFHVEVVRVEVTDRKRLLKDLVFGEIMLDGK